MVESLFIKETNRTPEVIFDLDKMDFRISGKAIPEDSIDFFSPIFDWMEEYLKDPCFEKIVLHIYLEYF